MKKLMGILILLLVLTGCTKQKLNENYDNMQIGKIESYELDLRIYGNINENRINEMYKINNYQNSEYKIVTKNSEYYLFNGKTYKSNSEKKSSFPNIFDTKVDKKTDNKKEEYTEVDEVIFHNSNLILEGLTNSKKIKKVKNDIENTDYKVYKIDLEDAYVKKLLNELGYDFDYKTATGKVYLNDEYVYKVIYEIDNLTINGSFFKINKINKLNLDLK